LKNVWQKRLMVLVSAWAGVELEQTSMYGLRQYEAGARLLSHVDRMPTHAVSLIVNIAQDNLSQPWPIEVFDHADRLHEVTMEPGDIVYYESAKNLHGRNRPLACKGNGGCSYVNLFTHYRPVHDGAKWHRNLNDMPNRPPPLLKGQVGFDDDSSVCTLPDEKPEGVGIGFGAVQCDDSRLGPYVSPTLYKANSAKDLFKWWKYSSDPNFIKPTNDSSFDDDKIKRDEDGHEDGDDDDDDDDYEDDEDDNDERWYLSHLLR